MQLETFTVTQRLADKVTRPYIPSLHGTCEVGLPFVLELERGVVRCAEGKMRETRPVDARSYSERLSD